MKQDIGQDFVQIAKLETCLLFEYEYATFPCGKLSTCFWLVYTCAHVFRNVYVGVGSGDVEIFL